jgi:hypothetical protein
MTSENVSSVSKSSASACVFAPAVLSIDALDVAGTIGSDNSLSTTKTMDVHKIRLNSNGRRIGALGAGDRWRGGEQASIT